MFGASSSDRRTSAFCHLRSRAAAAIALPAAISAGVARGPRAGPRGGREEAVHEAHVRSRVRVRARHRVVRVDEMFGSGARPAESVREGPAQGLVPDERRGILGAPELADQARVHRAAPEPLERRRLPRRRLPRERTSRTEEKTRRRRRRDRSTRTHNFYHTYIHKENPPRTRRARSLSLGRVATACNRTPGAGRRPVARARRRPRLSKHRADRASASSSRSATAIGLTLGRGAR